MGKEKSPDFNKRLSHTFINSTHGVASGDMPCFTTSWVCCAMFVCETGAKVGKIILISQILHNEGNRIIEN